ncbi:PqiC family protein [Rhodopila sp.]|uniref:PqiC family protein n=1 Tax=Rhodopila sp. TaxID=2480087 RepID=UPI003D1216CB
MPLMSSEMPRRAALLLLAAAPAACTSPNPILYVLAPVPGTILTGAPRNVALRAISLARYLERSQIVRSSEGYRLDVLSNEWWGEPLDALMNRILVQELAQRLPGSTVYADNGAISMPPDATVEINLQRFDLDHTGAVLLLAQVAVRGHPTAERGISLTVRPSDQTTSALVAAMSTAVGRLADAIAALLVGQ